MTSKPHNRRRLVLLLALGACAVVGGLAVVGYREAPRLVTWAALRNARERAIEVSRQIPPPPGKIFEFKLFQQATAFDKALEAAIKELADDFGELFRAGYFDPQFVVEQVPREGFTPDALPLMILCGTYAMALEKTWDDAPDSAISEVVRWARTVCRSARAKESLVNLLIRDLEVLPGHFESGGLPKKGLMAALTCRDVDDYGWGKDRQADLDETLRLVLGHISIDDWRSVLEHSRHEREGVRAGAFLLLCHYPRREVFVERAREALQDPSRLVRIAAAVALAYHRDASGDAVLVEALEHERWEIRWWCARSLAYFADASHLPFIQARRKIEPDAGLRRELSKMERAWR